MVNAFAGGPEQQMGEVEAIVGVVSDNALTFTEQLLNAKNPITAVMLIAAVVCSIWLCLRYKSKSK